MFVGNCVGYYFTSSHDIIGDVCFLLREASPCSISFTSSHDVTGDVSFLLREAGPCSISFTSSHGVTGDVSFLLLQRDWPLQHQKYCKIVELLSKAW